MRVVSRIPLAVVDAVEDADEVGARPRSVPSSPYPISPPWISRAYWGETVVTISENWMPPFM